MSNEFEELSVDALVAQLEGDYDKAARLFDQLITKYPYEASPLIRRVDVIYKGTEKIGSAERLFEIIGMLDKAEQLIKSKQSKYSMDKWDGLRDVYFLRGFYYHVLAGAVPSYSSEAQNDFDRALDLDPDYENARIIKVRSQHEQSSRSSKSVSSTSKSGGCFIATATYGSYNATEVVVLRNYRDIVLSKHLLGRIFIKVYYMSSSYLVAFILKFPLCKEIIKKYILDPIVKRLSHKY